MLVLLIHYTYYYIKLLRRSSFLRYRYVSPNKRDDNNGSLVINTINGKIFISLLQLLVFYNTNWFVLNEQITS